jgi:hypothetical protein
VRKNLRRIVKYAGKHARARLYALGLPFATDPRTRFFLQRPMYDIRGRVKGYEHRS